MNIYVTCSSLKVKCDYHLNVTLKQTDRQTDAGQSDLYNVLC